jgi:hypothetical protein
VRSGPSASKLLALLALGMALNTQWLAVRGIIERLPMALAKPTYDTKHRKAHA